MTTIPPDVQLADYAKLAEKVTGCEPANAQPETYAGHLKRELRAAAPLGGFEARRSHAE